MGSHFEWRCISTLCYLMVGNDSMLMFSRGLAFWRFEVEAAPRKSGDRRGVKRHRSTSRSVAAAAQSLPANQRSLSSPFGLFTACASLPSNLCRRDLSIIKCHVICLFSTSRTTSFPSFPDVRLVTQFPSPDTDIMPCSTAVIVITQWTLLHATTTSTIHSPSRPCLNQGQRHKSTCLASMP